MPDVRDMKLHQIESVATAAPRLAAAIVHGTPVEDTHAAPPAEHADSPTKMRVGFGIVGEFPPLDRSVSPTPGIDLELASEIDPIVMVGSFRVGADSGKDRREASARRGAQVDQCWHTIDVPAETRTARLTLHSGAENVPATCPPPEKVASTLPTMDDASIVS